MAAGVDRRSAPWPPAVGPERGLRPAASSFSCPLRCGWVEDNPPPEGGTRLNKAAHFSLLRVLADAEPSLVPRNRGLGDECLSSHLAELLLQKGVSRSESCGVQEHTNPAMNGWSRAVLKRLWPCVNSKQPRRRAPAGGCRQGLPTNAAAPSAARAGGWYLDGTAARTQEQPGGTGFA